MDSSSVSKFVGMFQERMHFFIPRFEECYQKCSLLKKGDRSTIFTYKHISSGTSYAVKELNIKNLLDFERISATIDSFALADARTCNKNNILCCEGFYYKFNRQAAQQPSNSLHLTTIDFFLVLERCDGSLEDLFANTQYRTYSLPTNILSQQQYTMGVNNMNIGASPRKVLRVGSLSSPPLLMSNTAERQYQDNLDLEKLFSNLKNLILQLHELDGNALTVESFHFSDILYKHTESSIHFKFSKICLIPGSYDHHQIPRNIAHTLLLITLGMNALPNISKRSVLQSTNFNSAVVTKIQKQTSNAKTLNHPLGRQSQQLQQTQQQTFQIIRNQQFPIFQQPSGQSPLSQQATQSAKTQENNQNLQVPCVSVNAPSKDSSYQASEIPVNQVTNPLIELLAEAAKQIKCKFEYLDATGAAVLEKVARLLEKMARGITINQCFYEILKLYNGRELFFEFHQNKLCTISASPCSLSQRKQSTAQPLLFSLQQNLSIISEFGRTRSLHEDTVFSSASVSNTRKRSSVIGGAQEDISPDQSLSIVSRLKDNTLVTLVQTFQNLVNAVKQKKKRLRFEKYLTAKETKFLKTIEPSFCPISSICIDFSNFYQEDAMQLAGEGLQNLVNLQGLELNFDYWNEALEDQFTFMLSKIANLEKLQLLIVSFSCVGQKRGNVHHDFAQKSIQSLYQAFTQLSQLICLEIDLTGWNLLKTQDISKLISGICTISKLQQLSLNMNDLFSTSNFPSIFESLMFFSQLTRLKHLEILFLSFKGWGLNKKANSSSLLKFLGSLSEEPLAPQGLQIFFENYYQNMREFVFVDVSTALTDPLRPGKRVSSNVVQQEINKQLTDAVAVIQKTNKIALYFSYLSIILAI